MVVAGSAHAGSVHLDNGSIVKGQVKQLADGTLAVATEFAGRVTIDADHVAGVVTDEPMVVTLDNGDEVRGRLVYADGQGQRLADSELRPDALALTVDRIQGLRTLDAPSPAEKAQAKLREAREDLWSGRLRLGVSGESGNSSSRDIQFGAKAQREAETERLYFSMLVDRAREDGEATSRETSGSVRWERDFSERFFAFAQTEAERDKFANVDFRSTTTIGPGYYFLMQDDHELKGRLGLGYEYRQPETDEGRVSEAVLTFGYDYMLKLLEGGVTFTHELTVLPQVSDQPTDNFRVDSVLGLQAALGENTGWSLLAEYRHEYDNSPEPGVEELDSAYLLNLVRAFE